MGIQRFRDIDPFYPLGRLAAIGEIALLLGPVKVAELGRYRLWQFYP